MDYTINDEELALNLKDIVTIFYGLTNNIVGHSLVWEWMESNYEQISGFATYIIDAFAITSNSQSEIDLMNQFVDTHKQDLQDSLSGIQDSISKAELNVQWNELHGEKVLQWLTENYGKDDDHSAAAIFSNYYTLSLIVMITIFLQFY